MPFFDTLVGVELTFIVKSIVRGHFWEIISCKRGISSFYPILRGPEIQHKCHGDFFTDISCLTYFKWTILYKNINKTPLAEVVIRYRTHYF